MTSRNEHERIGAELLRAAGGSDTFSAAVRATRMPMVITDPRQHDNPIVFVNDAFVRLTGYSREEILGRNCRFLQGPKTDPADVARIRESIERRVPLEIELLNHRKDGTTFWNRLLVSPVFEGDELIFFFASQFDVTLERELERDHKALEAQVEQRSVALARSEEQLRFALAAGRLGAWSRDLATGEMAMSAICKEIFGRDGEAPIAYGDLLDIVHPDDRPLMVEAAEAAIVTRSPSDVEYRILHRDGVVRWALVRGQPSYDENGSATQLAGIALDVTDRKAGETKLVESEARFRNMSDNSPVMIWTTDFDGRCTYLNARWREFTGQPQEEGLGFGWLDATHPDDRAEAEEIFVAANAKAEPFRVEYRLRRADGSYRWAIDSAAPRFSADGRFMGYVGSVIDIDDRKATEAALERSNQRFQGAVAANEGIIWTNDPDGRMTGEQPGWSALTGQSRSQYEGYGWSEAVHPDDAQPTIDAWNVAVASRSSFVFEHRVRRHDGEWRLCSIRAVPVFGADGSVTEWVGVHTDVTERRASEAALRESEGRFRGFAQALPNQIWTARPDGHLDWFNERVYAYSAEEPGSLDGPGSWGRLVHPDDLPEAAKAWSMCLASGEVYETEFRIRRYDGAYRWFLVRAVPIRSSDRGIVRWIGTNTDIEDRKRQSVELANLNATLEARVAERTADRDRMWRLSTDLMLVARFDATITAVNPAWTTLFGWAEDELLLRPFLDLVHPDDIERTLAAAGDLSDGRRILRFENRYRAKDGTYRWLSWTAVPNSGLIHAVGRDVSAEKAAEEELGRTQEALRQSQKMEAVGQLTGGLAHDFNNLLAGISGSLEMMQSRIAQGRVSDVERYMVAAQGAAKRAAALTHRLLAFSRRQTLDPKPTSINALIMGMEDLVRRTVGPAIAVESVAAGGVWPILVDPNQLENALLNLCINARDVMPDGGNITIETANRWLDERAARERDLAPGQYVSMCVSDNGTGMTSDIVERAFDPFFTTKPIGVGTGLGLSMIYGFARQSGGQVRIYSEVGKGTMVCVYLPRHLGEAEVDETRSEAAPALQAESGATVLVVDDEPLVRMLVVDLLEDNGYVAIEAGDGPQALKVLRSEARIDLLITDVGLPNGMNGRQVADAARELRPGLKVLFVTGYAENAVLNHGHLEPGMQIVTKPFQMEELGRRISRMIEGDS